MESDLWSPYMWRQWQHCGHALLVLFTCAVFAPLAACAVQSCMSQAVAVLTCRCCNVLRVLNVAHGSSVRLGSGRDMLQLAQGCRAHARTVQATVRGASRHFGQLVLSEGRLTRQPLSREESTISQSPFVTGIMDDLLHILSHQTLCAYNSQWLDVT